MFLKIGGLQNFTIFRGKHLEPLFNKVAGLQISCEYCKIIFFHKTPPLAASEKFINDPGKHQRQRCNRFIFLTLSNPGNTGVP